MALSPVHFFTLVHWFNMINHRLCGVNLVETKKSKDMNIFNT